MENVISKEAMECLEPHRLVRSRKKILSAVEKDNHFSSGNKSSSSSFSILGTTIPPYRNIYSVFCFIVEIFFQDLNCVENWNNPDDLEHEMVHYACLKDSKCGKFHN